ncbi:Isonitrile hydratase [Lachnellula hyalina]|uniref:Isonitrile hydratase n=1 Tax=Lachnellula hyalina TaxID=1316788 RepID=A0A8H8TXN5_9HELO|nr:Isonitrile hydratase [Lachnellula hyalina]TVY25707.1 Isonitrile hydratase [Lachnellula hyalina]
MATPTPPPPKNFAGPLEILTHALHTTSHTPVFTCTIAAASPTVLSSQNCSVNRDIALAEAYAQLAHYDVLVIPGGGVTDPGGVLEVQGEPLGLVKKFAELGNEQRKGGGGGRERTLFSVCTGSLVLGEAGVLDGKSATTHCEYYDELEEVCARWGRTEVLKERFVVNSRSGGDGGGNGLRIITAGGVSCGMDASLWLIREVAGLESAQRVAEIVQYAWRQGVVV